MGGPGWAQERGSHDWGPGRGPRAVARWKGEGLKDISGRIAFGASSGRSAANCFSRQLISSSSSPGSCMASSSGVWISILSWSLAGGSCLAGEGELAGEGGGELAEGGGGELKEAASPADTLACRLASCSRHPPHLRDEQLGRAAGRRGRGVWRSLSLRGGGEVQRGEEAGYLRLQEPDPLAEYGRPLLFRLEGRLGHSQLFLDGYDSPLGQLLLEPGRGEGGGGRSLLLLLGPGAQVSWRGRGRAGEGKEGSRGGFQSWGLEMRQ